MSTLPFRYTIGLEIHVELNTQTKMFCRCLNAPFGAIPNEHTCPVCMGLPGTLPVPNREAVRKTILLGKALGSRIDEVAKFDRKHYFYPDSPKGYQISQYDQPFCQGGSLSYPAEPGVLLTVGFERVHLEEDAGKLLHAGNGVTQVDLNRAGVPLMEMVTKPELHQPEHARAFVQEVRQLVRTLGVSEADMEKGQLRCDVNVSIQFEEDGKEVSSPITEIKNVNSTRSVERALIIEGQRLFDEWMANGPVRQRTAKVTAGYDETTNTVRINRIKEAANEYRYFPEPDIPLVRPYSTDDLNPEFMTLPELPAQTRVRLAELGASPADVELLLGDTDRMQALTRFLAANIPAKGVISWLVNAPEVSLMSASQFAELLTKLEVGELAAAQVRGQIGAMAVLLQQGGTVTEVASELGLLIIHDQEAVAAAIAQVLADNQSVVQQYKEGNQKVMGFLVGQVMKASGKGANPAKVQAAVQQALSQ